ncbi:MAG: outer membrane protein transport protein, partial [Myxococcales bacterium]|nr:outer membrane protein transport protein [Myxococcales bacterium]
MITRFSAALAPLVLLALAPSSARAGGMEVGDTGAEALGRGGAFTAKADNPTAVNYNPAGFAKLRGHHAAISANIIYSDYTFQRLGGFDGQTPYPTIASETPLFAAPMHLMASTDFGYFKRVTFGFGIYMPAAATRSYPRELNVGGANVPSPARFDFLSMQGIMLFPTAALAIRLTDWLDVGVTFQTVITKATIKMLATVAAACETPEDASCDVDIDLEVKDMFSPTGSLGFLMRLGESVEVGGMLRLPSSSELKGTANVGFGPGISRLENSLQHKMLDPMAPQVTLTNDYPWMMRLGGRIIFRDKRGEEAGDIELDLIYERWSAVSKRTVLIEGQSLGKPMPPSEVDYALKDTFSVRLGGAYRFRLASDMFLTLRAGVFGETATTSISDTRLGVLSPARVAFTGGVGLKWGFISVDVAFAQFFFPKRVVGRSTVTAQDFGGGVGPTVGNGVYAAKLTALALQVSFAFGQPKQALPRRTPPKPDDYDGMGLYLSKNERKRKRRRRRTRQALASADGLVFSGTRSYATKTAAAHESRTERLQRARRQGRTSSRRAPSRRGVRDVDFNFSAEKVTRRDSSSRSGGDSYSFEPTTVRRSSRSRRVRRRVRRYRR